MHDEQARDGGKRPWSTPTRIELATRATRGGSPESVPTEFTEPCSCYPGIPS